MKKCVRGQATDSALVYDEPCLQPWFLSKQTYLAMSLLLPRSQLSKMRYYFQDYGCLKCGSIVVRARVVLALKRRFRKIGARVDRTTVRKYLTRLQKV